MAERTVDQFAAIVTHLFNTYGGKVKKGQIYIRCPICRRYEKLRIIISKGLAKCINCRASLTLEELVNLLNLPFNTSDPPSPRTLPQPPTGTATTPGHLGLRYPTVPMSSLRRGRSVRVIH